MESMIHAYLRVAAGRARDTERIGPFFATFTLRSANPYLSYAIPDDGAVPSPDDVATLIEAYVRRGRVPRLEYVPSLAPAVSPALIAAGFVVEGLLPLMTCTPGALISLPAPAGIQLLVARTDDELLATVSVQREAYGEPSSPGPDDVASARSSVEAGGIAVLARDAKTMEPAGAGICTVPHEGVTEVAGIGVRAPFRRRGIAAAVTARLAREAFSAGVTTAFLMAAHAAEERIYARVGFVTESEILHISRPSIRTEHEEGEQP